MLKVLAQQIVPVITVLAIFVSYIVNRDKTYKAGKIAFKKVIKLIPVFVNMLILVSIVLFFIPDKVILHYLGDNGKFVGVLLASLFGSITLIPGFIAYPLSGILLGKGVSYMVLSAFTTTLMMVGVVTFPIERKYFGTKVTIMRNMIGLGIALITAVITGIFFGEIF